MKQESPKEIVIHAHTLQKFMKYGKDYASLIALYAFYIYHANNQKTNQPLATNDFVKRGLGWSLDKIKRIKRILKELKLIEVVRKGLKYYVRLPFIYTRKKIEKIINNYKEKREEKEATKEQEKPKEKEKKEPNLFLEYLISSKISKRRANQIRNTILSIEDIDKYQRKFHSLYLARWIVYCEKMGIRYNKGNLASWIKKMSSLFSIEQYRMIDNSIGMLLKDLKVPKNLKYEKYKGRSVKLDGVVYKNLTDVFFNYVDNKYVYQFDDYKVTSSIDIDRFFREYEHYGVIGNIRNMVKRF